MNELLRYAVRQPATLVWGALIVATSVSWALGTGTRLEDGADTGLVAAVLVGIALVKVRLVIRYFMEVREAPLALRLVTDLWCVAVGVAILGLGWGVFGP